MYRIMHLVLHGREELPCNLRLWIVIYRCGIDVSNLLIQVPLACTDVPNTLHKLPEISSSTVLKPGIIKRETFSDVFLQDRVRPYPELGASQGLDPISNGDDHIKIIEICFIAFSIRSSSQVFLDNCLFFQFSFFEYIANVQTYILFCCIEQRCHLSLRKPNSIILKPYVYLREAILRFVDYNL